MDGHRSGDSCVAPSRQRTPCIVHCSIAPKHLPSHVRSVIYTRTSTRGYSDQVYTPPAQGTSRSSNACLDRLTTRSSSRRPRRRRRTAPESALHLVSRVQVSHTLITDCEQLGQRLAASALSGPPPEGAKNAENLLKRCSLAPSSTEVVRPSSNHAPPCFVSPRVGDALLSLEAPRRRPLARPPAPGSASSGRPSVHPRPPPGLLYGREYAYYVRRSSNPPSHTCRTCYRAQRSNVQAPGRRFRTHRRLAVSGRSRPVACVRAAHGRGVDEHTAAFDVFQESCDSAHPAQPAARPNLVGRAGEGG